MNLWGQFGFALKALLLQKESFNKKGVWSSDNIYTHVMICEFMDDKDLYSPNMCQLEFKIWATSIIWTSGYGNPIADDQSLWLNHMKRYKAELYSLQ